MRAFLIDPDRRSITEIDFFGGWEMVSPIIGSLSWKTVLFDGIGGRSDVWIFSTSFCLDTKYWYRFDAQPPKAGRALVLGVKDSGDYCDTTFEHDELAERVVFTKRKFRGVRESGTMFTSDFRIEVVAPIIEEK